MTTTTTQDTKTPKHHHATHKMIGEVWKLNIYTDFIHNEYETIREIYIRELNISFNALNIFNVFRSSPERYTTPTNGFIKSSVPLQESTITLLPEICVLLQTILTRQDEIDQLKKAVLLNEQVSTSLGLNKRRM